VAIVPVERKINGWNKLQKVVHGRFLVHLSHGRGDRGQRKRCR